VNSDHISENSSYNETPTTDPSFLCAQTPGYWRLPLKILLGSLFIQASFSYRGMQNLGFAFSMLPLTRLFGKNNKLMATFLMRHLQLFNTHPYLSGPIIGSAAGMEKSGIDADAAAATVHLKNTLMSPYAALGDSFFWGALRPFAAVFSVLLALQQSLFAPAAFLLLFNPAHLWIRIKGFAEGYHRGRSGVDFIRLLDLPLLTGRIRWISLAGLGGAAVAIFRSIPISSAGITLDFFTKVVFLSLVLLCYWGIKKGISQVKMLYWMFAISCGICL
jgi:PTS system mannose-specific IID component